MTVAAEEKEQIWSCGMHCLSLRDAEMFDVPDVEWAGFFIQNFLGYTYQSARWC